jgi:hypothetical protein
MAKSKDIDFKVIRTMTEDQQKQVYYTLAKRANQRFRDIENKAKLHSHAVDIAREFLMDTYGRTTFKQTKNIQGIELKENLKKLEEFFTSKSASAKGIRATQKQRINTLTEKFTDKEDQKKFKSMMKDATSKNQFFNFLKSRQYQNLMKTVDSDQLIEDFTKAMDEGFSLDEIMTQYEIFQNSEMTFEQVAERREQIINSGRQLLK